MGIEKRVDGSSNWGKGLEYVCSNDWKKVAQCSDVFEHEGNEGDGGYQ